VIYEDGLGELEIRVLFMQLLPDTHETAAPALAEGWDGDRYRVYEGQDGAQALVWYSVWDTVVDADEFAQGLEQALPGRRGPSGRRTEVRRLELGGMAAVRLIDASTAWEAWRRPPGVRIIP
jgi:hypothetical protein